MKKFTTRALSYTVAATMMTLAATASHAGRNNLGDLEIYQPATGKKGNATIMMMLDTSGSMEEIDDVGNFEAQYINRRWTCVYRNSGRRDILPRHENVTLDVTDSDGKPTGQSINFSVYGCPAAAGGRLSVSRQGDLSGYVRRIDSLKLGLLGLLADGTKLSPDDRIGVGHFPLPDGSLGYNTTGRILVPSRKLDLAHRLHLMTTVIGLNPRSITPIPAAYGEAGAYMMGTTTFLQRSTGNYNSGFPASSSDTKKRDGVTYQSPVHATTNNSNQCGPDGYGIYFLTDGQPNNSDIAPNSRNLGRSLSNATASAPPISTARGFPVTNTNAGRGSGWDLVGEYAKRLREPNPSGTEIRTATVGFGAVFAGFRNRTIKVVDPTDPSGYRDKVVPDCDSVRGRREFQDLVNLCKWGEYDGIDASGAPTGGYGGGGFTSTGDPAALAQSVADFIQNLTVNNTLSASPSGVISIPTDPLAISSLQPYAYMPMLQPEFVQTTATWQGNLKKFHTLQGTLFGKDGATRLYHAPNAGEFPYAINPAAMDIWQQTAQNNNSAINTGGAYSQLVAPTNADRNNIRKVYVEDEGQMKLVGVQNNRLVGFDRLSIQYTAEDKAYILHFLGFSGVSVNGVDYSGTPSEINAQLERQLANTTPAGERVLGGVLHSVPALVAYQGEFDGNTGNVSPTQGRDDYVLYGSMDGALHLTDADDGTEAFAFIPRKMFESHQQRSALSTGGTGTAGIPVMGVDAPWIINAKYNYDYDSSPARITVNAVGNSPQGHIRAYGGLRLGGRGIYGLDLTDRNNPALIFSATEASTGFDRIGRIWAKPVVAKIKTGSRAQDFREVIIFGGGYDMRYEEPNFVLPAGDVAEGNAVYMLDAKDGTLLASWSSNVNIAGGSKVDGLQHMRHSIVGDITVLDRNNNGYVDHLYFADLGGQVFRIDLHELSAGATINSGSLTRSVVRVFDANAGASVDAVPFRFYEAPVVSFYDEQGDRFAVVNVSSGDRSSPLARNRGDSYNRIYGILDRDIASSRIANRNVTLESMISKNLTTADLVHYDAASIASGADRDSLSQPLKVATGNRSVQFGAGRIDIPTYGKLGWYYDMNRFDGRINVENLKGVGPGTVIGNVYYSSVYSPDFQFGSTNQCSARVVGATEHQLYCLPWGVCDQKDPKSTQNGTRGYIPAGQGIQEMAISAYTTKAGESTSFRTFLTPQTLQERIDTQGQYKQTGGGQLLSTAGSNVATGADAGADALHHPDVFNEGYRLKVSRWYDLQNAEQ